MQNFNPVRGTYDYLPREAKIREIIKQKILSNYESNGYNLISTPILESLEYLNSSEGGDNLRLMFKKVKRGDKLDLTKSDLIEADIVEEGLRYDLTVPLARFYSCNREKLPVPFKAIQIGDSFRAERPQKGRNREFVQCDIDVFGDASVNAELELIRTTLETYKILGFEHIVAKINNRKILNELVLKAGFDAQDINSVCITLDKLDKIAINGVMMELIEKGYDAEKINKLVEELDEVTKSGLDGLKKYGVDEKTIEDMKFLISTLNKLVPDYDVKFDISIVRGQGYYTGTVYEFYTDGFGGAIGGGGRYDKMVGKITGVDIPAVGASIGFEPVTMLIKEKRLKFGELNNLALIYDDDDDIVEVFKVKDELRKAYNVSLFKRPKNMKNFYEKIIEVADFVVAFKDYKQGKELKKLI